jgi:type IV pilus assembly protein PilA
MKRRREGFTLVELLIVITVIGLLASVAMPKFSTVKQKGYRSQAIADLTSLRTAEENFFVDSNRYATVAELGNKFSHTTGVGITLVVPGLSNWTATLTHPNVPGMVCGIAIGLPNPINPAAGEGEPICQ